MRSARSSCSSSRDSGARVNGSVADDSRWRTAVDLHQFRPLGKCSDRTARSQSACADLNRLSQLVIAESGLNLPRLMAVVIQLLGVLSGRVHNGSVLDYLGTQKHVY
jgi:hypothetical protein